MIKPIIVYTIICDGCGADISNGDEFAGWSDPDIVMEYHEGKDWIEQEGDHYCPLCWEWDSEEENKVPTNAKFAHESLYEVVEKHIQFMRLANCDERDINNWVKGYARCLQDQLKLSAEDIRKLVKTQP